MLVFEPSRLTYRNLLKTLRITQPTPFAEQDFLNKFFQSTYKPIPLMYNLVLAMLWRHPENVHLDKVKVVHYCAAGSKPWRYTGEEVNMDREDIKMLVKKWLDIYNDPSLDYKAEDTERTISIIPSIMVNMPEPAVSYIPAPSAA
jgi:inositol 3-alpha-galactosyltransferase